MKFVIAVPAAIAAGLLGLWLMGFSGLQLALAAGYLIPMAGLGWVLFDKSGNGATVMAIGILAGFSHVLGIAIIAMTDPDNAISAQSLGIAIADTYNFGYTGIAIAVSLAGAFIGFRLKGLWLARKRTGPDPRKSFGLA